MIEFPKMIFRVRKLPNADLGGLKLDHRTVNSAEEQREAVGEGWIVELRDAVERVEKADKRAAWWKHKKDWYEEWKWLLGATGAVLALLAAIIKLLRP